MPSTTAEPAAAAALNAHFDTRTAAYELSERLAEDLDGECDLVILFGSYHHRAAFEDAASVLRQELQPRTLVAVTAESVIGADTELEGRAGLSAMGLRLPGASIRPYRLGMHELATTTGTPDLLRRYLHVRDAADTVLMFADPFSTPTSRLLGMLRASEGRPSVRALGGLASGASQPGHNLLVLDRATYMDGAVGVTLGGVRVDTLVSQGCRPVGPTQVVTAASGGTILELGGRRAVEVAQEVASSLGDEERKLLGRGLFVGFVINEYRDRFGRGDFVVRNILGADANGGLSVGERARVGQTVQFHLRDADTADEDLQLLLDAQQLESRPFGALLVAGGNRGTRLFQEPGHDAAAIQRRLGPVPLTGFLATGEIGSIGDRPLLHGHTACVGLLRR